MLNPSRRRALALFGAGAGTAALVAPAAAADAKPARPPVEHFATPHGGELTDKVKLTDGTTWRYFSLYTLKLPALAPGDVLQVHAQFQIANNVKRPASPGNVALTHFVILHPEEAKLVDAEKWPDGFQIVPPCHPAGENISPDMHYGFRTLVGSMTVTDKTKRGKDGSAWVSVVVYAASTGQGFAGESLDVQKGYGGLNALVFRQPG